ncbi:[Fructose-bisphosphate aldolase]-lysine N-methyltransferase, chloroplastic [Gracilariopsis chorda]|uniref:[Fructose-bisphosphate aldolase]-lysine N-methyltransferase, chloroplastic n=1 Tax=Gracilariopsis chorda TaxID=448386 RepID=A0A2V3IGB4_9FLOR|nr:[Fructose-bisphosphate aldolase]-lysine N-methyltransferase, chloroplastic [Gracilariopsis chorda]|eukprot:PXF41092.1 [Fructose-bisphosphate aldolase]-lysine N-methyltransferase, chloroplastic [Gracilariopsis chorda]
MTLASVEDLQVCKDWLRKGSGTINGVLNFVSLEKRSRRGVPISAKKTVLERTELLVLPEGKFVGVTEAKRLLDEAYDGFCSCGLVEDPETYVSLAVLLERSKGSRSEFAPFLRLLPIENELDCVPMWSDKELEMLHGSPSYTDVKTWLKDTEDEWKSLDEEIFQKKRDVFPSEHFSLRRYQWALCITSSRGFYASQSEPAVLAPILSFLSPSTPGSKPSTSLEMKGGMFFAKKKLVLTAKRDMEDGNVLTISLKTPRT